MVTCAGSSEEESTPDPLEPPWPDLVIAASRRSAPVARRIRRQSGGYTRLVHLFHTQAPLAYFDLIVTVPQYRLPQRPNVLHLASALNRASRKKLADAADRWRPQFESLPRSYIALIVGGSSSSSYLLDPQTAARLGSDATTQRPGLPGAPC